MDQAPDEIKAIKFRERWECLSKEASEQVHIIWQFRRLRSYSYLITLMLNLTILFHQLLDIFNPRLIVAGHTHHGCRRIHRDDVLEFTIPSFSWRNKVNPSLLMVNLDSDFDVNPLANVSYFWRIRFSIIFLKLIYNFHYIFIYLTILVF